MNRVDGKVALVSGAASGIGAETARTLAAAGAVVVLTDVQEDAGRTVAAEILAKGSQARFRRLDVTREADWENALREVCTDLGGLDVLVNNAGIELIKMIDELTLEDWHRVCRVNLDGVFLGT